MAIADSVSKAVKDPSTAVSTPTAVLAATMPSPTRASTASTSAALLDGSVTGVLDGTDTTSRSEGSASISGKGSTDCTSTAL